ncbi:MAG: hypothetical protein WCQ50_20385 [Spirochaetota bacterium]
MRFLALVLVLLLCGSCGRPAVRSFSWTTANGGHLAFSEEGGFKVGSEGFFGEGQWKNAYHLARPYVPPEPLWLSLELSRPKGPAPTLLLSASARDGRTRLADWNLALTDPLMKLILPLPAGAALASLSLEIEASSRTKDASVSLLALSFVKPFRGFEKTPGVTTLSPGFALLRQGSFLVARLDSPFKGLPSPKDGVPKDGVPKDGVPKDGVPKDGAPKDGLAGQALRIDWAPGTRLGSLELRTGDGSARAISLDDTGGSILLPRALFPSDPGLIEARGSPSLELLAFVATAVHEPALSNLDLGVILALPQPEGAWASYRWDRRPEVIVLDFADYAAQDRALKRLAYFVEKKGFKGRLAPDSEIEGLHGWNAHDYRAADLAAFYSAAAAQSFQLGQSETRLRELLSGAGVIRVAGKGFAEGRGALISISRESAPDLRTTFMAHESSHALYFTDPDFRAFVGNLWSSLGKEERWFWTLYFGWMNYETTDEDLMANEFMAYLWQRPPPSVREYFTKTLPSRLIERHAELEPAIALWMASHADSFERHATEIDAWLASHYGFASARPWSFR